MKLLDRDYPIAPHASWEVVDATKLRTFTLCPRKFFYEYVVGIRPDFIENHLVFGGAFHKGMEIMLLKEFDTNFTSSLESLVKSGIPLEKAAMAFCSEGILKEVWNVFIKEYEAEIPKELWADFSPKTPERAMLAYLLYADTYRFDRKRYRFLEMDGKKSVELSGTISLGDDLTLAWMMDAILQAEDGTIVGLEHKTASSFLGWPELWNIDIQPGIYKLVLNAMFPEQPSKLLVNGICFKKTVSASKQAKLHHDVTRHFDFVRCEVSKSEAQLNMILASIQSKVEDMELYFDWLYSSRESDTVLRTFPMREVGCTFQYGRQCPYLDFCISIPNPLRLFSDDRIPPGFVRKYWNPLEKETNIRKEIQS